MSQGRGKPWHNSDELNTAVINFHDKYARQPIKDMEEVKPDYQELLGAIRTHFDEKDMCSRIEYMGSSYEGVKVPKTQEDKDIEFDVMLVMSDGRKLLAIDTEPGYAQLKARQGLENDLKGILSFRGAIGEDNYVDATKVYRTTFGELHDCKNSWPAERRDRVTLREHGPAVQIDVYEDSRKQVKMCSVDIVPAFDLKGQYFIAKPFKHKQGPSHCWRKTFNIQEKDLLKNADAGNCCRKQVLRTLKVIRNREPGLNQLTSYHLKTALPWEMNRSSEWSHRDVGKRLMGTLRLTYQYLRQQNMPHRYIDDFNLLDGINRATIDNMRDRGCRLLASERQMMAVLNS